MNPACSFVGLQEARPPLGPTVIEELLQRGEFAVGAHAGTGGDALPVMLLDEERGDLSQALAIERLRPGAADTRDSSSQCRAVWWRPTARRAGGVAGTTAQGARPRGAGGHDGVRGPGEAAERHERGGRRPAKERSGGDQTKDRGRQGGEAVGREGHLLVGDDRALEVGVFVPASGSRHGVESEPLAGGGLSPLATQMRRRTDNEEALDGARSEPITRDGERNQVLPAPRVVSHRKFCGG